MNIHSPLLCAGALLSLGIAGAAEPVMRDVVTHDQLVATYQKSVQAHPQANHVPAEGEDPSKARPPESIVSQSDFLAFAGRATLVPKRAILHIPANMADRVKFTPGSKIMTWADFFAMNRAWVSTIEVTRSQAQGNQPFDEKILERIGKSSTLVVAVYKTGPISVLPLKAPTEPETAAPQS